MRIDNIFEYLYEFHQQHPITVHNLNGCTVKDICTASNYARTAVSEDLSKLTSTHQVIKVKSRPVLFFARSILEKAFSFSPRKDEYASLTELEGEIHQEMEKKEQLKGSVAKF